MKKERRASLRKIIANINLSQAEDLLKNHYKHQPGKPGRPPISPTGLFLSFLLMFLRMESYRDFHEFLEKDQFWRRQLGFKDNPDLGTYSHFIERIGLDTFNHVFKQIVQQLITNEFLSISTIVQDGTIIPANLDDPEAAWGWDHIKKKYVYGYKLHAMVTPKKELPIAFTITPANIHDSQQFPDLYKIIKTYDTRFPTRFFIGDKAFDSRTIRQKLLKNHVTPIIKAARTPIKSHYPKWFTDKYVTRVSIERFFSRLKEFLDLKKLRIYGKKNLEFYIIILLTGMLLIGYMNQILGHSPRSIKTFKRLYL
jgi:IS5 family transposase